MFFFSFFGLFPDFFGSVVMPEFAGSCGAFGGFQPLNNYTFTKFKSFEQKCSGLSLNILWQESRNCFLNLQMNIYRKNVCLRKTKNLKFFALLAE